MAYKEGNVSFETKLSKEIYQLQGVVLSLDYVGKETKLSKTEKHLISSSKRKLISLIKLKLKTEYPTKNFVRITKYPYICIE